jgi:hypothetical protein
VRESVIGMQEEILEIEGSCKSQVGIFCFFTAKRRLVIIYESWVVPKHEADLVSLLLDCCSLQIFWSFLNQTPQKLEVGNLYFLRGLISVSDREMCSPCFEIEIHEYIYLAIPPSRRLACSSSYYKYNHVSLFWNCANFAFTGYRRWQCVEKQYD